jgi:hypothetical protein
MVRQEDGANHFHTELISLTQKWTGENTLFPKGTQATKMAQEKQQYLKTKS